MQENTGPICPMQVKARKNAISAHWHPTAGPCAVDDFV